MRFCCYLPLQQLKKRNPNIILNHTKGRHTKPLKTPKNQLNEGLKLFMEVLGLEEEPMGIHYTDKKPDEGYCPKEQIHLKTLAREPNGMLNWNACILAKVKIARVRKSVAYFDESHYGCLGGAFFMGFKKTYEPFEPQLISTGIPGQIEGERYLKSPEEGRRFYDAFKPPPASGSHLVVQPITRYEKERPELVVFFVQNETLVGLNALTVFLTGEMNAVQTPFGVGCCGMISWPRKFLGEKKTRAVIGCFDVICRRYMKRNELTYTVPYDLFIQMVNQWKESVIGTKLWDKNKKRM